MLVSSSGSGHFMGKTLLSGDGSVLVGVLDLELDMSMLEQEGSDSS